MFGKIAVAPCGHNGETIIGNYVKCLQGCDTPGKKVTLRRGEPGHVDDCACKPCQIRRRAYYVVLRTKDGKDFCKLDWDGVADSFTFMPNKSSYITGFKFLDKDEKVVAEGPIKDKWGNSVFVDAGFNMTAKPKFMMRDAEVMAMEISQYLPTRTGKVTITMLKPGEKCPPDPRVWTFDIEPLTI